MKINRTEEEDDKKRRTTFLLLTNKRVFLPPGPIDYAEHVIQGSQEGYAGVQTHDHLIMSRLPQPLDHGSTPNHNHFGAGGLG